MSKEAASWHHAAPPAILSSAALHVAPPTDADGDTLTITVAATPLEGFVSFDATGSGNWVALPEGPQSQVLTAAQFASLVYQPDNDGVAEDLTPLVANDKLSVQDFALGHVDRLRADIAARITKLS